MLQVFYLSVAQVLLLQTPQTVLLQQRTQTGRLYVAIQVFVFQYLPEESQKTHKT